MNDILNGVTSSAAEIYLKFVSRYLAAVFMRDEYKTIARRKKNALMGVYGGSADAAISRGQ